MALLRLSNVHLKGVCTAPLDFSGPWTRGLRLKAATLFYSRQGRREAGVGIGDTTDQKEKCGGVTLEKLPSTVSEQGWVSEAALPLLPVGKRRRSPHSGRLCTGLWIGVRKEVLATVAGPKESWGTESLGPTVLQ